MALYAKFPVDLPPEYYAAIGEIAARWNWLEFHLGMLVRVGFGLGKKEGRILTGGMAVKVKCPILKIMAKKWVKDRTLQAGLHKLADDIQKMTDDRNELVHALYCHKSGQPDKLGRYVMMSGDQRYLPHFDPVPVSRLQECASDLRALQDKTVQLAHALKKLHGEQI